MSISLYNESFMKAETISVLWITMIYGYLKYNSLDEYLLKN